jgi:tetratricopeptide (TPR) repeat protein
MLSGTRFPGAAVLLIVLAQAAQAQNIQTRERQRLDPQSDTWVATSQPATQAVEALSEAREKLARGDWRAARRQIREWMKSEGDAERYAEAELLLGETYFQQTDFYAAYEHFEIAVENAGGELYYEALKRQMDVARAFLAGKPRWLWRIFRMPAYDDGVEILGRVWERAPGTRLAEDALKLRADFEFERGNVAIAQDEYANLAREYPNGRYTAFALLRSAVAAEAAFPGIRFQDRALLQAEERYRQLQANYPAEARREDVATRLDGIREQRAAKDLDIARWYERTRQSGGAIFYYRLILSDWPGTLAEDHARRRLHALGVDLDPRGADRDQVESVAPPAREGEP